MVSWSKNLDRKTFALFDIPAEIKRLGYFEDGKEYLFSISAGKYRAKQILKVTSGLEVSIPSEIQKALINASKQISHAVFKWDDVSLFIDNFDHEVKNSLQDTSEERRKRLRKAKQSKAKQSKAKQSKAKQSKAKQSKEKA